MDLPFEAELKELERRLQRARAESKHPDEVAQLEQQLEKRLAQTYAKLDAWDIVQICRHPQRPRGGRFLSALFEDTVELCGDRAQGEDPAITAALGRFRGINVAVLAQRRGQTPEEQNRFRFGMPGPAGYRKAVRLMRLAERLGLPLVTFVDTPGAYPGVDSERGGLFIAIAECIETMISLKVPTVSVVIGEGGSGGALALAVADRTLMMRYAIFSVISPEGCASILWRSEEKKVQAARLLKLTAPDAKRFGIADEIIPEPLRGAHYDPDAAVAEVACELEAKLSLLVALPEEERLRERRAKYRAIGSFVEG